VDRNRFIEPGSNSLKSLSFSVMKYQTPCDALHARSFSSSESEPQAQSRRENLGKHLNATRTFPPQKVLCFFHRAWRGYALSSWYPRVGIWEIPTPRGHPLTSIKV
jgi:hypothetical protein